MLHRRLAVAATAAALLAFPASMPVVADAAKPKRKAAQPEFAVSGSISVTSTLTSICAKPSYGDDVVVTEKTITIRRYTFKGDSGTPTSPGRMTSRGEETIETDTKVAGETDILTDQHVGPVKRVIPGSETTFNTTFRRTKDGKGRNAREAVGFDMTGLTGSSRAGTIPMPRRGRTAERFLEPVTKGYKDRRSGPCTYSDQTFTSGFITVTRRR